MAKKVAYEKKASAVEVNSTAEDIVTATSEETAPKKREFNAEDQIRCKSLVNGGLYIVGERTKFLYTFADYGDEVDIEYQDLIYMIRSHDKSIYAPRIIIKDNDIINQYPEIKSLYDALYTIKDLKEIVNYSPNQIKKIVEELPDGAVASLKGLISTMIDNHSLDSVTKIKALDEILGTNFLLALAQN